MPDLRKQFEEAGIDWIHMAEWGKDHWSTFLYAENRAVDHHGGIDSVSMRGRSSQYPCMLQRRKLEMYSDYDCLQDMVVEGLLEFVDEPEGLHFKGSVDTFVKLTDKGWFLAGKLRQNRATDGTNDKTFNGAELSEQYDAFMGES